MIKSRYQFYP